MSVTSAPRGAKWYTPHGHRDRIKPALLREALVNHILIIVDASGSMRTHERAVRQQLRDLMADLAEQSKTMDQEVRVGVYSFSSEIEVLAFDTDVLRLPPVDKRYSVLNSMTALNDAMIVGIEDTVPIPSTYGDHAYLAYVITDGFENDSVADGHRVASLLATLDQDRWTVAAMVPDRRGARAMHELGVPIDNVAIWNVHSRDGFTQAGTQMRQATTNYMQARASGVTSTRSLFSTGSDAVNQATVAQAVTAGALVPLTKGSYVLQRNSGDRDQRMDEFFPGLRIGSAFYEYTKRETIQRHKQIAVVRKGTGEVYVDTTPGSPGVRAMIGLPQNVDVRESPNYNPEFTIFVQSTAANRSVRRGTQALMLR